jgi:hypothetical protein
MKWILTLLITFLYLTSTFSIGVEVHYCNGKLKSVHFLSFNSRSCCCKKRITRSKSCCKDEVKFFKVLETHKNQNAIQTATYHNWLIIPFLTLNTFTPEVAANNPKYFLPIERRWCESSLFLSNRTLRL